MDHKKKEKLGFAADDPFVCKMINFDVIWYSDAEYDGFNDMTKMTSIDCICSFNRYMRIDALMFGQQL